MMAHNDMTPEARSAWQLEAIVKIMRAQERAPGEKCQQEIEARGLALTPAHYTEIHRLFDRLEREEKRVTDEHKGIADLARAFIEQDRKP